MHIISREGGGCQRGVLLTSMDEVRDVGGNVQPHLSRDLSKRTGSFPARHVGVQKIEKQELAKILGEKVPALAEEHVNKLDNM